eukprot:5666954-Alexandrium_andersonii.AAC.1
MMTIVHESLLAGIMSTSHWHAIRAVHDKAHAWLFRGPHRYRRMCQTGQQIWAAASVSLTVGW